MGHVLRGRIRDRGDGCDGAAVSEQVPTNQVSLDDLKRAIALVPVFPAGRSPVLMRQYLSARGDAWRTAFEWLRPSVGMHPLCEGEKRELDEGMRLIREKLR